MTGAFVWYDLMTSDLTAGRAFYDAVIGWNSRDSGLPGDKPYWLFSAGLNPVAGAMQLTREMTAQGARPGWMGHVQVENVAAKVDQAVALGGRVHMPETPVPGVGWFAIIADPQGAVISLFKLHPAYPQGPKTDPQTPGHAGWRELLASDWPAVFDFYSAMFGWTKGEAIDIGPMGSYQLFKAPGGADTGGMFNKPADVPVSFWLYYFNVESCVAALERVKAGGGQVLMGPMQVPGGSWIAQCMDPQGAMFAVTSAGL
jgi:uncharacterized protein